MRALVVNAGNANAGTGDAGLADAHAECVAVARCSAARREEVLPYLDRRDHGAAARREDRRRAAGGARRARAPTAGSPPRSAIMTTDTVPKGASRRIDVDGVPVTVTGIAKGAGMIHPDMATMLAFIATDAPIAAPLLARDRARGRRRLVQRRDRRRRHVDQRQLRARRHRQGADRADHAAPTIRGSRPSAPRSRQCAVAARAGDRARRRGRDQVHRRSASKADATSTNAGASRSASRIRRSSRPRSSRPTPTSAASSARSATPPRPTLDPVARVVLARRRAGRRPRRARRRPIARRTASA